jgi:hypothetical protein
MTLVLFITDCKAIITNGIFDFFNYDFGTTGANIDEF